MSRSPIQTTILATSTVAAALLTIAALGFSAPTGENSKLEYNGKYWCVSNWIEEEDANGNRVYLPDPDGRGAMDHRLKGKESWLRLDQVEADTKEEAEQKATRAGLFEASEKVALREALDKSDIAFFTSHFNTGATHPGPCVGTGMGTGLMGMWINDSIRKDCFDIEPPGATSDKECGFDRTKLSLYASGGGNDPGAKYAQSDEAKQYATSTLKIDPSTIKRYSKSEVEDMIRAEIARQYSALPNKYGSTQAQAQQAILSYQEHESSSFQLFDSSMKPSYTFGSGGAAVLDMLSLSNDKFQSKNRRVAASYDIKFAIYMGVSEHMTAFQRVSGTGSQRWKNTIGYVFLPSDTGRYWSDSRSSVANSAWNHYANETVYACPAASTTQQQQASNTNTNQTACGKTVPSLIEGVPMLTSNSGKFGREQHLSNTRPSHYSGTNSAPLTIAGNGAFSPHTTDQEHWYITHQWTYADFSSSPPRVKTSSSAAAVASKIKHARLVIRSTETGKTMIVSAEEAGPAGWVTKRDGVNFGGPPEVYKYLGTSDPYTGKPSDGRGKIEILGFTTDQSAKLGPCQ